MTDITTVASPATAQPAVPPILFTKDLPGPLSLNRLAAFGTLHKLDDSAGYWIEHSGTLYGRAKIVAEVAPFGTVVCSMTAAWVWLGGPDFPSTIDVIFHIALPLGIRQPPYPRIQKIDVAGANHQARRAACHHASPYGLRPGDES